MTWNDECPAAAIYHRCGAFCAISPENSRMEGRFTCTDMQIFDGQRTASSLLRAGSISLENSRMECRFTILFSACDKPPVSGVKIPDQCGQRSPYIMGKTGHELSVGFIRPAERGQLFLVGGDDLIDFIGDRRGKLVRRGQNAPVAIPRSDILKRVKHFLQPRFYTPDYQNADQNGSGGSYD